MQTRVPITVRLESFEGPLDLLLYLIQTHELDVSGISITRITDQYLSYVRLMQELDFDVASEFLVMAATLLLWKSRALLPKEETGDATLDEAEAALTQEQLIHQLLNLQRYKRQGEDLAQLPRLGEEVFVRPNARPPVERRWQEMGLTTLVLAYQNALKLSRRRKQVLKKETVSLSDKIHEFASRLTVGKPTPLAQLIADTGSKPEVVVTFLASLELARLKRLKTYQERTYADIFVELIASLEQLDYSMVESFSQLAQQTQATPAPEPT